MSTTVFTVPVTAERAGRTRQDWPLYSVLFASTSVIVGVLWDISWHQTIGRDTFWTPAHLAIYLGGVVAGVTCGWLALRITFAGSVEARASAVTFWTFFRAPLGAWVCIWGAFAMLTSAPFDDWWHDAYGLDVKILSPPHALLAAGIGAIQYGAMLMALASQNRAPLDSRGRLVSLYLYSAGLFVLNAATLGSEFFARWGMHQAGFYKAACVVFPLMLVGIARGSLARWPATIAAAIYMSVVMAMMWILPRFPGEPGLGPIYVHVTTFHPPDFPLLLVVPSLAIDLVMQRWRRNDWLLAAVLGAVFLAACLLVQWPFADFLMTPWARNDFFAAHRMPYGVPPAFQEQWFQLRPADNLARGLPIALALGIVSARCGLWWGNWMSRVRR